MNNYNLFLCYRGESGGALASSIYSELGTYTKDKLNVFFAPRCISKGENFKSICKQNAGNVSLMILILTPDFFADCKKEDDIVYCEMKAALSNEETSFLPITMPGFEYNNDLLSELFSEVEIDRFKHISAIKFTDVYSFSSIDMLVPIVKEKVGIIDYDEYIIKEIRDKERRVKPRIHIAQNNKGAYFGQENVSEVKRLDAQQKLLLDFDMPIYEKYLQNNSDIHVLDVGCGNGKALMARLGKDARVTKIVGIDYSPSAIEKANETYAKDNVSFYNLDIESDDFEEHLDNLMQENGIEKFNWINILAVMSHLKHPFKLLKIIRKKCAKNAVFFIRNIDDGLNLAYPDEENMFCRAFNMLSICDTTGYRKSGRELFSMLKRIDCKNICFERFGLTSDQMDYDQKDAMFDVIFGFLKNGIIETAKNNPKNMAIIAERDWLLNKYSELEECFQKPDFFVSFGFLIIVGCL